MNRKEREPTPASADQLASVLGGLGEWLESMRRHSMWQDATLYEARKKQHERFVNVLVVGLSALITIGLVVAASYGVYQRPSG